MKDILKPSQLNLHKLQRAIALGPYPKLRLAEICGCSRQTIDNILQGNESKLSTLFKMAHNLGMTVGFVLDENELPEEAMADRTKRETEIGDALLYEILSKEDGYLMHITCLEERIRELERFTRILQAKHDDLARAVRIRRRELGQNLDR